MKHSFLAILMLLVVSVSAYADPAPSGGRVNWQTNYEEAVRLSKSSSKPIILFFTGSDWCGWCKKLDQEALHTQEFADAVGDKFIFVLLDFPLNSTLPQEITTQNKRLQKQFGIEGFPTLVILDSQQNKIGSAGYRAGGGKAYAQFLQKIVEDNKAYQGKMQGLEKQQFSGAELKQLYKQANDTGRSVDADKITLAGIESDKQHYFLIERYRSLAAEGKLQSDEAVEIKQRLLSADPTNAKQTYYQVALVDFEVSCKKSQEDTPEHTVASLVDYINAFGEKDKDNLWRLQMMISQVFLEKNQLSDALIYAQSSYKTAPSNAQPEIASAINNIRAQIH